MRETILEIILNKPKHFSKIIKNEDALNQWVISNTLVQSDIYSEMVYSALSQELPNCKNNKRKKFKSINNGYIFCGRANECQCAKESVSKSVSEAKQAYTEYERNAINSKRVNTTLRKYGVENNGQTKAAKHRHAEFYTNSESVSGSILKFKQTCMERYGVDNPSQLASVKQKKVATSNYRYGVDNPSQRPEIQAKIRQTKIERYEPFHLAKLNYTAFIKNCIENFGTEPLVLKDDYEGIITRPVVDFQCTVCQHKFTKRFDYAAPPICKVCNPTDISYKSKGELEIYDFCKTLTDDVVSGDRSRINPYELDIFLPEYNLAIEYNGLYWHSELSGSKSWNYHYRKFVAARGKQIQLLTIYSDEWESKKEIIQNMIRLKTSTGITSIYARNTDVRRIDRITSIEFINKYHLQGAPRQLPINYGLYFNGALVAVMSFKQHSDGHELIRFCSSHHIVGGASKLLNAFKKEYTGNIISFSNNRYSDGKLYRVLGFTQHGMVPPMQEYVISHKHRIHKRAIGSLIKESKGTKTEWQAARDLGYDRIWDCGKIKWVYTV